MSEGAKAVLTAGEWKALLYQAPDQVRPLVYRLAVHHGAVERPAPASCPLCRGNSGAPGEPASGVPMAGQEG